MRASWSSCLALGVAVVLGAFPAGAEERTLRSIGIAGIRPGDAVDAARQKAVAYGVAEAVYRVVADELPALDADEAYGVGRRLFRGKARDYVTRFQVLEDRGTRPKQLSTLPGATAEYVVEVEAVVAVGAVRERLARAGLLAPAGQGALRRVRLTLEQLPSYAAYEAVRQILVDRLQADSALPVEFTARRAVLEVLTRDSADRLLRRLAAVRDAEVRVLALEASGHEARATVHEVPAASLAN